MKTFFTLDFDAFFASCEESRNPSFKFKPLVIGKHILKHNVNRGVVSTANYLARELGIYSSMPLYKVFELEKKHNIKILVVEPDMEFYLKISEAIFTYVFSIVKEIKIASIDECYFEVSNILIDKDVSPEEFAKTLQQEIFKKFNISVSIGIGNDILISKIASKVNKPMGIYSIYHNEIEQKLWKRDISELYGAGKKTVEKLRELSINTIGELALIQNDFLLLEEYKNIFGIKIVQLIKLANGYSNEKINSIEEYKSKSFSTGETFIFPLQQIELEKKLLNFVKKISNKIVYRDLRAKTIFIKVKLINDKGHNNKKTFIKQKNLGVYINDASIFYNHALILLEKFPIKKIIHLTFGVSNLKNNYYHLQQKTINDLRDEHFNETKIENKKNNIKDIVFKVNSKFDQSLLIDLDSLTKKKNDKIKSKRDTIKFKVWDD